MCKLVTGLLNNKCKLFSGRDINKMVAFNKQLTFSDAKADSLIADDLLEMVNKHRYLHGENIRDLFITCINQIKKQYLIADTPNKVREISNSLVTFMASEATILNNSGYSAISINT
jgi:hypothetical protein